ncbi:flagellar basal-body rod modification protein FlgD [Rubricella aquisinus]|uniref:Basal-body rod modification protein FlgD n=1 Tax=Rubricella aquisinus TaxID=2028108 RepID=A0A840WJF6_9RHOB|nr:flagellar hook capping FlgD N-terminal domain-containing protein [Rubricella aquisinus]MBB5515219.1 flagellar basal-body rod modification protein FlgD [Rubricella aquisinus]
MDVTATQAQRNAATPSSESATQTAQADFETFIKLLTAQMRHQDPLEPLNSTEFVAQLASFSSVEQQIATNQKLDTLAAALSGSDQTMAAQWLGRSVLAEGAAHFSDTPITAHFDTASSRGAKFIVRDTSGAVVFESALTDGTKSFDWDGSTPLGPTAPDGRYVFERETVLEDGTTRIDQAKHYQTVEEVRFLAGEVMLHTSADAVIALEDVTAIRNEG